tara:strand:- start:775 stop:2001 length:1227 start_codon:yes stop_codon:yes gene_type:complete
MSRRIVPLNMRENIKNVVDGVKNIKDSVQKDINENVQKINHTLIKILDEDMNGKIELNDADIKCNRCFNFIDFMYDVSIDNIPLLSIFGLFITVLSFVLISIGINGSSNIILKYLNVNLNRYFSYYIYSLFFVGLLHISVFLHGFSLFILETCRELCQIKEVGCYCCCKNKKSRLGRFCRCCQSFTQTIVQLVWGCIGSIGMFIMYIYLITFFIVTISSLSTTFMLKNNCNTYISTIDTYKNISNNYLSQAKLNLNSADSTALTILTEYENYNKIKKNYIRESVHSVNNIKNVFFQEENNENIWEPEEPNTDDYFPIKELNNGRNVISTLNDTIYKTEAQILFYNKILHELGVICYDFSSIYDYLYFITQGSGGLLISHFIMFAAFLKYYSIWNYEVKLIKLNNYYII